MDIADLFSNQDYELQDFEYKDVKLEVLCSKSATTDFDLTGQIIWPSAIELAKYIIDNKEDFKDKNILELGAGAGLSGIVAYQYASNVYITDGNEIVQNLIKLNVEKHQRDDQLVSRLFQWGKVEALKLIEESQLKFDIIIGADIIFWPQSVPGLAETLDTFRKVNPNIKILITGAKRTKQSEDDIDNNLAVFGLKRTTIKIFQDYKQPVYLYEV